MGDWFSIYTLVAFLAGVFLAGSVKQIISQVKGKVTG